MTDLFRGLPFIIVLYLVGYGLPTIAGVRIPVVVLGVLAVTLTYSSYVAEVIRAGIEAATVYRFLESSAEADAVHAENLRAHRLGINGVPCFVIGGRHAIAGAQEPEVLERLIDVALVEA